MSGESDLAQLISGRAVAPAPVVMFDARITECQVTYDAITGAWVIESVTIRPLNTTDNIGASWSYSFEQAVTALQGRDLVGLLVEVHVIGNRPRVAYTVRG